VATATPVESGFLGRPLHVLAGNHDVGNVPTRDSLQAYRKAFGPDQYSIKEGGIYGIVLNSQLIDAPENVPEEAARQLSWVREELDRARAADAMHILVFLENPAFAIAGAPLRGIFVARR
jgi:hypothetical protein